MAASAPDKNDGSKSESSGGIKAMLPLILNLVLLPVIAFVMTQFVLLPRLNQSAAPGANAPADPGHGDDGATHGESSSGHGETSHAPAAGPDHGSSGGSGSHGGDSKGHGGAKDETHMLESVTVNVAGTMGSRLLMAKIGIRGTNPKLPDLVKDRAQDLRDAASSLLQTKTLMDIERQGARNTIRAELKNAFARVIGQGSFSEVVIPDMAVQ
jgi:flagellar basal body-associated protein FliL